MGDVTSFERPPEERDLRAAFQVEIEQAGLSMTRAAEQIGRSGSAISRWLNGTYSGNVPAVEADVERWLATRADAAKRSLEGAGLDRHSETVASRQITSALAYAQAAGDIVAVIGRPGRGKTWASERYCAGKSNAYFLSVSSAVFTLPGLLSLVGHTIGAGRQFRSALEAETTIIERLSDRKALIVVDEAHHLRDKLLDELRIIRDRAHCGLALVADEAIRMALARCQQVDGRVGLKVNLTAQPVQDIEQIAAAVLERSPGKAELKTLNAVGRGPGGLHALRRLLGRAWMVAQAAGREKIEASDIAAAADESVAAEEGAAAEAVA
ncbi:MAG: AAA family ATPase [Rhodospirillaceae bacterium]|nr:AAA family ATPase [Rhodospirillaceae bacterium]